ncbi:MAG TPA: hypothetical protein VID27_18510, partial [Blastocatellia bacterium]
KFRVRQRAAEARLESARGNLARITDIISEIDRQVNSLRRQAAKARRYGVLRNELRELLRRVYLAEDRKLAALLEETKAKLDEVSQLERSMMVELGQREEDARKATRHARTIEDELTKARSSAAEAVLRRDRQARECSYQREQFADLAKRQAEVRAEAEALSQRLQLIEDECRRLREEDARLQVEAEETASSLKAAEQTYAEKLSATIASEAQIETARSELLKQTAFSERLREIGRQLDTTLERLSVQAETLAKEGERAATQYSEKKLEVERFAEEIANSRQHIAQLNSERETAVDAVVQGHEAVSDTEAELLRVRDEYSRTRHKLESLQELDQRRAYYSPAVQMIFSDSDSPRNFNFIGTLADALNVDAKWERAIEGVLGSSLQAIVVPTPLDALRAAEWLKENGGGRASFLVMGLHGGSDEIDTLTYEFETRPALLPGFTAEVLSDLYVSDLLGAPRELVMVLKRTLPERMGARIARNLEDAMARSIRTGELFVTLNGDWIAAGQLVSAGDARDLQEGAGLLTLKRELRELETRLEVLQSELTAAETAAKEARARVTVLEEAVVLYNEA